MQSDTGCYSTWRLSLAAVTSSLRSFQFFCQNQPYVTLTFAANARSSSWSFFVYSHSLSESETKRDGMNNTHSEHGPPVGGGAVFCIDCAARSLSTESLPAWEAKRNISRENVAPVKAEAAEAAVPPVITSERIHLHLTPFSLGLRAAQIVSHINVQKKSPEPPSIDLRLTFVMCEVCKLRVCVCV